MQAPQVWAGDRLVVSVRDQGPNIRIGGRWTKTERPLWIDQELMLVNPFQRRAETLIEMMIWPVVGDVDEHGGRLAYAIRSPWARSSITVERYHLPNVIARLSVRRVGGHSQSRERPKKVVATWGENRAVSERGHSE